MTGLKSFGKYKMCPGVPSLLTLKAYTVFTERAIFNARCAS